MDCFLLVLAPMGAQTDGIPSASHTPNGWELVQRRTLDSIVPTS